MTLKCIRPYNHPYEIETGKYFSTKEVASDPRNHCVPFYDVFDVPDDKDKVMFVMPALRMFDDPPFETVGEVIDFIRQILEVCCNITRCVLQSDQLFMQGLLFMHTHHVAHR